MSKLKRLLLILEDQKINEFAQYNRSTFDEKLTEKLVGAIGEYSKYKVAILNNESKWVNKWKGEVKRLVNECSDVYKKPISGFKDKMKVFEKALSDVRGEGSKGDYARYGNNKYEGYYKKKPRIKLTTEHLNKFLDSILAYFKSEFSGEFLVE